VVKEGDTHVGQPARGPNDPGRRDRIVEAALDVIAE
jgi:DNA-binding transcriptional regulator YbjK